MSRHHAVGHGGQTEGAFQARAFDRHAFQAGSIDIDLPDGTRIDAIDLAEQVIEWWATKLARP